MLSTLGLELCGQRSGARAWWRGPGKASWKRRTPRRKRSDGLDQRAASREKASLKPILRGHSASQRGLRKTCLPISALMYHYHAFWQISGS